MVWVGGGEWTSLQYGHNVRRDHWFAVDPQQDGNRWTRWTWLSHTHSLSQTQTLLDRQGAAPSHPFSSRTNWKIDTFCLYFVFGILKPTKKKYIQALCRGGAELESSCLGRYYDTLKGNSKLPVTSQCFRVELSVLREKQNLEKVESHALD